MSTEGGSSGAPILNTNNKLIGVHKEGYNNKGTFLNYPLKEIIQFYTEKKLLQEFNTKYKLKIRDTNITKLNLRGYDIGDEGLKDYVKWDLRIKRIKFI